MSELNREQIIKALECCSNRKMDCDNCPYSQAELADNESCAERMEEDAITIIKELTEENERLINAGFGTVDCAINKIRQAKADTVRKMQDRLIAEFRKDDRMNYYIRMTLDQIAKELLKGEL